jgi:hypothetical protein
MVHRLIWTIVQSESYDIQLDIQSLPTNLLDNIHLMDILYELLESNQL